MKIAFIYYFDKASWIFPNWRDGHRAAIEEIAKKHEVEWFLDKKLPEDPYKFDFILIWDDSNTPAYDLMFDYKDKFPVRVGICLTTNPTNPDNLRKLDIVFVESQPIYNECRALGLPVIKAFGTDVVFFKPNDEIQKDIEYFYPATFSPWKRQRDIAYLGDKLLCVGTVQPDGEEDYQTCLVNGVKIEVGYFPVEKIRDYYQRTKHVIIPAVHGSERTVLEAMACDILPEIVHPDINQKAYSYIREYQLSGSKSPRQFIWNNYSHKKFANNLLKGIER